VVSTRRIQLSVNPGLKIDFQGCLVSFIQGTGVVVGASE